MVAIPSDKKDTVQEVRNRSLAINASATGAGVNVGNTTDDTYARYRNRHSYKIIKAKGRKTWRLSVTESPIVHVYVLFPNRKDGPDKNLYYMSESTQLDVEGTPDFVVDESDFDEDFPVVEVTFNADGMVTIKTPSSSTAEPSAQEVPNKGRMEKQAEEEPIHAGQSASPVASLSTAQSASPASSLSTAQSASPASSLSTAQSASPASSLSTAQLASPASSLSTTESSAQEVPNKKKKVSLSISPIEG